MKRTRLPVVVAGMTTFAMVLSGCASDNSSASGGEMPTIRVAHNSNAGVLPARVAEERGYFEEEGVAVEFRKVENIATLPPALGKSFDIALSTPTLTISASSQGIPVVEVSGATLDTKENSYAAVLASGKSGIKNVKGLEGKTLGVLNEAGTLHTATQYWLKQQGVNLNSVEVVQVDGPAQADQLASGRIDAVETVQPFESAVQNRVDATVDLGDPYLKALAPKIAGIIWIGNTQWAKENAAAIDKFATALQRGKKYIAQHESDARAVLQEYTGLPEKVASTVPLPTFATEVRPEDFKLWHEAMKATGFKGDVNVDSLVPKGT